MTQRKKKPDLPHDMPFDEALERFINVNPKELSDALTRVQEAQREVGKHVEDAKESIRRGARRPFKQFRL